MRIQEVIESLKSAPPANVLWGPGCTPGGSGYDWNWALICLAALLRTGRVARVLTPKVDRMLVEAIAAERLTPPIFRKPLPEWSAAPAPAIYEVGKLDHAGLEWVLRGAPTAPWIVVGFGEDGKLLEMLRGEEFKQGLFWPGYVSP